MLDDPDDRPELRCVSCGYDLRGLPAAHTAFRCPECGTMNEILSIVAENQRRRQSARDLTMAAIIGLLIVGAVTIVPAARSLLGVDAVAVIAPLLVIGLMWLVMTRHYGLSHAVSLTLGIVTAALAAACATFAPQSITLKAALFLWIVGLIHWAGRR
jgi:predicted RNA-binding Zn-ribbon protein involved in translation (DUF1610 family)